MAGIFQGTWTDPRMIMGTTKPATPLTKHLWDPNERETFVIPLSRVVDMWQAKFGDRWIRVPTVELEEVFWSDAYDRLRNNGMFEVYEGDWYRLKEDV